jgi:DNA-binding NarL/FixJ family response regulator
LALSCNEKSRAFWGKEIMSIRIVLADDHEVFVEGLRALLGMEPDIDIVGLAKDGQEVVKVVDRTSPHQVVVDLSMPRVNGIDAIRQLASENPEVRSICLSMHSEPHYVEEALDAGAAGYVLKEYAVEELVRAIRAVADGQTFLCPAVAGVLVDAWKTQRVKPEMGAFNLLTQREREVLQLLAEGFSTKEIAGRLNVSDKTVGTHREHVMEKTGIRSVAGLTKYAIAEGITQLTVRAGRGG